MRGALDRGLGSGFLAFAIGMGSVLPGASAFWWRVNLVARRATCAFTCANRLSSCLRSAVPFVSGCPARCGLPAKRIRRRAGAVTCNASRTSASPTRGRGNCSITGRRAVGSGALLLGTTVVHRHFSGSPRGWGGHGAASGTGVLLASAFMRLRSGRVGVSVSLASPVATGAGCTSLLRLKVPTLLLLLVGDSVGRISASVFAANGCTVAKAFVSFHELCSGALQRTRLRRIGVSLAPARLPVHTPQSEVVGAAAGGAVKAIGATVGREV